MGKSIKWLSVIMIVTGVFFTFLSCHKKLESRKVVPLQAYVTIAPQAWFVNQIGGRLVETHILVPPGQDPHTFELRPSQLTQLGSAQLYFRIGLTLEAGFIPVIQQNLPRLTLVDCSSGMVLRRMKEAHIDEDGEESHTDEGWDPHVWLGLPQARVMALNIYNALVEALPGERENLQTRYQRLLTDIDDLDRYLSSVLEPCRGETIYVFHPAFGYFTDNFGLVQQAVEIGGKQPTPKQLENLIRSAREEEVRVIFVQPQFSGDSVRVVANAIDGVVVPIDPMAGDWLNNMKSIGDAVKGSF